MIQNNNVNYYIIFAEPYIPAYAVVSNVCIAYYVYVCNIIDIHAEYIDISHLYGIAYKVVFRIWGSKKNKKQNGKMSILMNTPSLIKSDKI